MTTAEGDEPDRRGCPVASLEMHLRTRNRLRRSLELARQAVDDLLILGGVLGVRRVFRVTRAACEVPATGRCTRKCARGDAVAIAVEIAREALHALEIVGAENLAAVRTVAVVPGEAT